MNAVPTDLEPVGRTLLSIVVPVYQNEANLDDTIPRLMGLRERLGDVDLELVFVEDGSRDASFALLERHQARHPDAIRVVKHTRNFGQMAALQTGLAVARGNCVGIISADLQDPCELFVDMVAAWRKGARVVIAERADREDKGLSPWFSRLFWKLVAKWAVPNIPPGGFDFCLLDRSVAEATLACARSHINLFVTVAYFGHPDVRIPYVRKRRDKGRSQWTTLKKVDMMVQTFFSFTTFPLKLMTYGGFGVLILSVIYLAHLFFKALVLDIPVPGFATLAVLICLFGGVTLFFLGLIGEYIWQIIAASNRRPDAVIERILEGRGRREEPK